MSVLIHNKDRRLSYCFSMKLWDCVNNKKDIKKLKSLISDKDVTLLIEGEDVTFQFYKTSTDKPSIIWLNAYHWIMSLGLWPSKTNCLMSFISSTYCDEYCSDNNNHYKMI